MEKKVDVIEAQFAKATTTFTMSTGETDFPFAKGQRFVLLETCPNGWSRVKKIDSGDIGLVPLSYVKKVESKLQSPSSSPTKIMRTSSDDTGTLARSRTATGTNLGKSLNGLNSNGNGTTLKMPPQLIRTSSDKDIKLPNGVAAPVKTRPGPSKSEPLDPPMKINEIDLKPEDIDLILKETEEVQKQLEELERAKKSIEEKKRRAAEELKKLEEEIKKEEQESDKLMKERVEIQTNRKSLEAMGSSKETLEELKKKEAEVEQKRNHTLRRKQQLTDQMALEQHIETKGDEEAAALQKRRVQVQERKQQIVDRKKNLETKVQRKNSRT